VDAALGLRPARPAAGPGVLPLGDGAGARGAADRAVALLPQRGEEDVRVLGDVRLEVVGGPAAIGASRQPRLASQRTVGVPARPGSPRGAGRSPRRESRSVVQRGDLAQRAARVGVSPVQDAAGRLVLGEVCFGLMVSIRTG
jgi:hypothetical protein